MVPKLVAYWISMSRLLRLARYVHDCMLSYVPPATEVFPYLKLQYQTVSADPVDGDSEFQRIGTASENDLLAKDVLSGCIV